MKKLIVILGILSMVSIYYACTKMDATEKKPYYYYRVIGSGDTFYILRSIDSKQFDTIDKVISNEFINGTLPSNIVR